MVNFSVFATSETMAPLVMAFFIAFGAMASAGIGSCDGAVARWCLGEDAAERRRCFGGHVG